MGIATDLRESGYLQPLSSGIRRYIDGLRKERSLKKLIESQGKAQADIGAIGSSFDTPGFERFNQRTQQMDQMENPYFGDFGKQTEGVRSGFIESLLPEMENLEPGQINLAMDSIESLIGANQPAPTPETKYSKYGQNVYEQGPTGEVDFEDPAYTIPGVEPTTETKYKKYGRNVYEVGEDGEVDFTKPAYTVPKEAGTDEDELPDYSKLLGEVNEGISNLENLISTAEWDGDNVSFTVGSDVYDMTKDQYIAFKEKTKNRYKGSAVHLLNEQGLDDAVEDVRALITKEGSLEKALSKFAELNGDQFNDEDLRILRDYFTLMSL